MGVGEGCIYQRDYSDVIPLFDDRSVQLVWTDPPFGTGQKQELFSTMGTSYNYMDYDSQQALDVVSHMSELMYPKLCDNGVLAVCLDYRIVHEAAVAIKSVGYNFLREIIYHFELGATTKNWWTNKHNTILLFGKDELSLFNADQIPLVERKSPKGKYVGDKKVNSVWSITMGNTDPQRTGYPNQKPLQLVEPFILVHTNPGDLVFDPFAGSGTTGAAAQKHGRNFVLCDTNPEAVQVMVDRGLACHPFSEGF